MNETFAAQSKVRLALVAPFIVLSLATVVLMLAALGAYGIADEYGYDSWAPVLGAYLFAVPVLAASTLFALSTWLRAARPFRLQRAKFLVGLACVVGVIALTIAYVVLVNDPLTYRSDKMDPISRTYEANLNQSSFLWFSFMMAVFFPCGAIAIIVRFTYLSAIETVGLSKPAGIDPIGEIMRDSRPA